MLTGRKRETRIDNWIKKTGNEGCLVLLPITLCQKYNFIPMLHHDYSLQQEEERQKKRRTAVVFVFIPNQETKATPMAARAPAPKIIVFSLAIILSSLQLQFVQENFSGHSQYHPFPLSIL